MIVTTPAATAETYTERERRFVAISTILGYGLDFYNLIILAFLLPPIQRSLGITLPQTGIVVSMTLASSVIGGILIGWLGDRVGRKNALLATLGLLAAGSVLSAFAWDFTSLLAFRIVAGIGVGGEWGVGMVLLNEVWRSQKRGFGSALVQAMSAAGTAIAAIVATFALTHLSEDLAWRAALLVGGLPIFLMIFVRSKMPESRLWSEYDRLRKAGKLPPKKLAEGTPLIEIFKGASLRYFILGTLMAGAYIISYQAISIFAPLLMTKSLGADPGTVRSVTLLWSVVSAVGMLASGYASDRIGRKWAIVGSTCIGIIAYAGLYFAGRQPYGGSILAWSFFFWYAVWGLGQGSIGIFGPWFSELFPVELRSTGTSVTFTTGRLIGSVMPYLVPTLAAAFGDLLDAMMFGVVGAGLSLVFALFLPETAGRRFAVVEDKDVLAAEGATLQGRV